MEQVYFGNWSCLEDLVRDFEELYEWNKGDVTAAEYIEKHDTYKINVLLAVYETGGYEGSALVIYEKDGQLYEVHGSHCSCRGLEGQWSPEETSKEYLLGEIERQKNSDWKYGLIWEYHEQITKALESLT